jgi:hypothetical protein
MAPARKGEGNGKGRGKEPEPQPPRAPGADRTASERDTSGAGERRTAGIKPGRSQGRRKAASPREQALRRWKEVEALVRGLEPRIVEVFRRYSVDPQTAGSMLEEVVTLLLYRWGEVARPEAWVMEMLEHRARRGL